MRLDLVGLDGQFLRRPLDDVLIALHTDHCAKSKLDGFVRPLLEMSRRTWARKSLARLRWVVGAPLAVALLYSLLQGWGVGVLDATREAFGGVHGVLVGTADAVHASVVGGRRIASDIDAAAVRAARWKASKSPCQPAGTMERFSSMASRSFRRSRGVW